MLTDWIFCSTVHLHTESDLTRPKRFSAGTTVCIFMCIYMCMCATICLCLMAFKHEFSLEKGWFFFFSQRKQVFTMQKSMKISIKRFETAPVASSNLLLSIQILSIVTFLPKYDYVAFVTLLTRDSSAWPLPAHVAAFSSWLCHCLETMLADNAAKVVWKKNVSFFTTSVLSEEENCKLNDQLSICNVRYQR